MDSDEHELEMIRGRMEQTRASLSDKLEALETQVRDTIQTATSAVESVSDTVDSVKESVAETAETISDTVRETFDFSGHIERHPWVALGCAVGLGVAGGMLLGSSSQPAQPTALGAPPPTPVPTPAPVAEKSGPSLTDRVEEGLGTMFKSVQGLAVSTLFGLAREMVASALPEQLQGDLNHFIDDLSQGLGGKRALSSDELKSVLPKKAEEEPSEMEAPLSTERPVPASSVPNSRNATRHRVGSA